MTQVTAPSALAKGATLTITGSVIGGALGLAFTIILSRTLGDSDAGVVLQAMGTFMIALALAEFGMDTATLWLIPRLLHSDPSSIRRCVVAVAVITVVSGTVGVLLVLAALLIVGPTSDVAVAVRASIPFLPFAAAVTGLLAVLRSLSGVRRYVVINNIVMPTYRPVVVILVIVMGGGPAWVAAAWASSYVLGLVVTVALTVRPVRRIAADAPSPARPGQTPIVRPLLVFGSSRVLSSGAQQVLLWADVLMVGLILGDSEAGVYGVVVRFFSAILLVDTALRMVVSPMFSTLIHLKDHAGLQELYDRCTVWLNLLTAPAVILMAVYAEAILEALSPGFGSGAATLQILSMGMLVVLAAGTIHNLLLMSGKSGLAAMNKISAMVLNVGLNLVLIPAYGIEGAALSWVIAMGLDAALAAIQVHRHERIHPPLRPVLMVTGLCVGTVALPALLISWLLGSGSLSLVVALVVVVPLFGLGVWVLRRPLHIRELITRETP